MGQRFRTDQFLPPGFELDRTEVTSDKVILFIRSTRIEADCPLCGASSGHVHSHHVRKPADLPVALGIGSNCVFRLASFAAATQDATKDFLQRGWEIYGMDIYLAVRRLWRMRD